MVPLVLVIVGIVVAVLTSGVAEIIGWGIVTVALTVAISLAFLEVGLSEDRERAREARRRSR